MTEGVRKEERPEKVTVGQRGSRERNQKDETEGERSGEGILRSCYSEKVMLLSRGSRCAFHSPGARS